MERERGREIGSEKRDRQTEINRHTDRQREEEMERGGH